MKKLLLVSTAIAGVALLSSPAFAALKMDLGGYFEGYGVYANNDLPAGTDSKNDLTFVRDSVLFFNGESTLDNGLTIGAHTSMYVGDNNESTSVPPVYTTGGAAGGKVSELTQTTNMTEAGSTVFDETYLYASGGWGRTNFGEEDGAAYLLQVAAPSADTNVDGMRVYVQGLDPFAWEPNLTGLVLDYQQADFRQTNRLTYLTPKFNGFQAGISYAPLPGATNVSNALNNQPTYLTGTAITDFYKNPWEAAARWDGEFQGVALSLGAGYSDASNKAEGAASTSTTSVGSADLKTYNFGGNIAMSGFSLGGAYKHTNNGIDTNGNTRTWDVGAGYDNGPYHAGLSYFNDRLGDSLLSLVDTDSSTVHRYAAGGGYTFGPGMSFRGSVDWGKFDAGALSDGVSARFTEVTVGTDVQF